MNRWTRAVTRGITAGVLWTLCGRGKNLQFGAVGVLCRRSGGSRTALPLETGTARGRLRDVGRAGRPALAAGVWHRRRVLRCGGRVTGSPARWDRARPLHLIHGAGLVACVLVTVRWSEI